MDNTDAQISESLSLSGANYVNKEMVEPNPQVELPLATLADDLVCEWLNQVLDSFEFTFSDIVCRSNSCTRNGNHNENQTSNISSDLVIRSVPNLKLLCHEALETSDNDLMNVSVGQFYGEEKPAHGKLMNGTETLLCYSMKEVKDVESLESDRADNHSWHNSTSTSLKPCDFNNLQNLLIVDTDAAEVNAYEVSHEVFRNIDINDETVNQIQIPVSRLLPTVMLNVASSTIEDVSDSYNARVNSELDCTSAHTYGLINSQDQSENIACRVTNSSDTFLTDEWNSTNNGSQVCLFFPIVQVSFFLFFIYI